MTTSIGHDTMPNRLEGHATQPLVRCEGVGHTYGSGATALVAVRGVNCEVPRGARVAVMGPSGSGKSTLLHLMAGLERSTTGRLTWPGFDRLPAASPGLLGVIFQGPSLIPALDVLSNVAFPLVLAGVPDAESRERARAALTELDLEWMAEKLPDELSGGQSQRAAIARVLATGPTLILADEPTGQLDRETGRHVMDVLIGAADRLGAALVVSTHDPDIARRLPVHWRMRDGLLSTTNESPVSRPEGSRS